MSQPSQRPQTVHRRLLPEGERLDINIVTTPGTIKKSGRKIIMKNARSQRKNETKAKTRTTRAPPRRVIVCFLYLLFCVCLPT